MRQQKMSKFCFPEEGPLYQLYCQLLCQLHKSTCRKKILDEFAFEVRGPSVYLSGLLSRSASLDYHRILRPNLTSSISLSLGYVTEFVFHWFVNIYSSCAIPFYTKFGIR